MLRTTTALTALSLLAVGCAPERVEVAPTEAVSSERMAVLASDEGSGWDIQILDRAGNELSRIDANLGNPVGLSYHPDDFFIVSDGSNLVRVELDGTVERFNAEPLGGILYRTSVSADGDVTVAQEYDVTELDDEGEVLMASTVPGTYCWMDAGGEVGSDPVLLDVFGPNLAAWDTETGEFEVIANLPGASASIMGVDGDGNYYVSSAYDDRISVATADGDVDHLGRLSSMGVDTWGVKALEEASSDSVYVLYEGGIGSGIVEVHADGRASEVVAADGEIWFDLTVW